jgi:hypothetical protein
MNESTRWQPLVDRGYDPKPERDGIDFVLTPGERSKVAQYSVAIERHRRRQNRTDESRQLGVAGTRV